MEDDREGTHALPSATRGMAVLPARSSEVEGRLVDRLQAGQEEAYEELLRLHGGRLLAVARRVTRNEEDAHECLQEGLLSAFRSIDRFKRESRLGTWLHRIVVNACLMRLRTRQRHPEELVEAEPIRFDRNGFRVGATSMSAASAEEILQRAESRALVREAIDDLSENHRIVLMLRDIEERTTAETASLLGCSPGAVKVRLHRARLVLRSRIESVQSFGSRKALRGA